MGNRDNGVDTEIISVKGNCLEHLTKGLHDEILRKTIEDVHPRQLAGPVTLTVDPRMVYGSMFYMVATLIPRKRSVRENIYYIKKVVRYVREDLTRRLHGKWIKFVYVFGKYLGSRMVSRFVTHLRGYKQIKDYDLSGKNGGAIPEIEALTAQFEAVKVEDHQTYIITLIMMVLLLAGVVFCLY